MDGCRTNVRCVCTYIDAWYIPSVSAFGNDRKRRFFCQDTPTQDLRVEGYEILVSRQRDYYLEKLGVLQRTPDE